MINRSKAACLLPLAMNLAARVPPFLLIFKRPLQIGREHFEP